MLPQLEKAVQDTWKELNDRKGERGIRALKTALKNKVIRKDCDWRLSTDNIKPFKAAELWTITKEGSRKGSLESHRARLFDSTMKSVAMMLSTLVT